MSGYTKEQIEQFRKRGQETKSGVAFDWGLAGPGGAYFILIREPHHTDADIESAKNELRGSRDVVSLRVERLQTVDHTHEWSMLELEDEIHRKQIE